MQAQEPRRYGYIRIRCVQRWEKSKKREWGNRLWSGMTNNVAEYSALEHAAEWVCRYCPGDEIVITGDSQLVIHQMSGSWQVHSETSKKFVPAIRRLLGSRKARFVWIPREQNAEADLLSNLAYSQRGKESTDTGG